MRTLEFRPSLTTLGSPRLAAAPSTAASISPMLENSRRRSHTSRQTTGARSSLRQSSRHSSRHGARPNLFHSASSTALHSPAGQSRLTESGGAMASVVAAMRGTVGDRLTDHGSHWVERLTGADRRGVAVPVGPSRWEVADVAEAEDGEQLQVEILQVRNSLHPSLICAAALTVACS